MSADPDDDLLIDLAIAASAAWIVTYNAKHFAGVAQFGVGVTTPKEFLAIIEKKL